MLIVKIIENNTMYNVLKLHLCLFSFSAKVIFASFTSSLVSVHYSTNSFLHLQLSQSKYSATSYDLSHSHSQLFGFQIKLLSHKPLSINSLYSHLHLSSFQRCLLLKTLVSNLHLNVLCYSMCLVSLVLDIRLNNLTFKLLTTSETYNFACGLLIQLQLPLDSLVLILKGKNTG